MTTIESEQSRETSLTEIARGPFVLRFISYRKSEDAKLNLRSEDYIVSELTPEKAVFALCDGVGSSFYGDIGSQILGETMIGWLGRVSPPANLMLGKNDSSNKWLDTLTSSLQTELNHKVNFATNIIQKKEIASKNELTRLAEKTQRDDFGTQSNFASGILWPKSSSLPNGLIVLFWLGNARLRIFNKNKDITGQLGWGNDPNQLTEVWSSKEGVIGRIYSHLTDFSKITTVIAYSDGFENVEDQIRPNLNGTQLEKIVNQAQSIKDDDVTYLELSTISGEVPGIADDIVGLLRNSTTQPQPTQAEPESYKLKQAFDALQKKYDAQSSNTRKIKATLIALAGGFSIICLSIGLLIGSVLSKPNPPPPTTEPSTTPSASATLTPSPLPSASETPTITETPTILTPSDTPTFTLTATNTETLTPTFTDTPTP